MGGGPQTHTRGTRTPPLPPLSPQAFPPRCPESCWAQHIVVPVALHAQTSPLFTAPKCLLWLPSGGRSAVSYSVGSGQAFHRRSAASQDSPSGWEGGSFISRKNRRRGIACEFPLPWRLRVSQPPRLAQGFLASDLGLSLHLDAAAGAAPAVLFVFQRPHLSGVRGLRKREP